MLRTVVPADPGVYEIRAVFASRLGGEKEDWPGKSVPPEPHRVVYDGAAPVRFRLISDGWCWAEWELYRVFCETFRRPPLDQPAVHKN